MNNMRERLDAYVKGKYRIEQKKLPDRKKEFNLNKRMFQAG